MVEEFLFDWFNLICVQVSKLFPYVKFQNLNVSNFNVNFSKFKKGLKLSNFNVIFFKIQCLKLSKFDVKIFKIQDFKFNVTKFR